MTLTIAIASESPYDEEIYRYLASRILADQVISWTGDFSFKGCNTVAKLLPAFLTTATAYGIRYAIAAVDNDGGARRRPEHDEIHIAPTFTLRDDDTCRECWLTQAIPLSWVTGGSKTCVAVPVQTIETWLLTIRKTPPFTTRTPEQQYSRTVLKKAFFGKPALPIAAQIALAMAELQKPDALATLAQRPSFVRFTAGLARWF